MDYKRSEIGAGIFLLIAFAVVAVMIFAVSDIQSLFKNKKEIKVLFQFSDGIEKNAQVRFSGIRVGKVTDVRVAPEQPDRVELTLSVYSDTVIKRDTKASIKTLGLVGGKYVELTGGSPQAQLVSPGGVLVGEESFKLEDLEKSALEVVAKLKNIAGNLDRIVGDPALKKSVSVIIRNVQDSTANIKASTENVKGLTSDPAKIILKNLQDTAENVKSMTSSSSDAVKALKNLPDIMKKIEESTANLKAVTDKTDVLVGGNKKRIEDTLENVKATTQNLKDLTEEVKNAPWKLIRKP